MTKHTKLRIESWCKKFCQITTNRDWKKNRNLHAISLLNMIMNHNIEAPYTKFAPDGPLPFLSLPLVKSSLSKKFLNYMNNNSFNTGYKQNKKRAFSNDSINNMSINSRIIRAKTPGEITFKNTNLDTINHNYEISNCNDPDLLKRHIEKLKYKINGTKNIINKQNEEKNFLLKKIGQLEKLIKSYKI